GEAARPPSGAARPFAFRSLAGFGDDGLLLPLRRTGWGRRRRGTFDACPRRRLADRRATARLRLWRGCRGLRRDVTRHFGRRATFRRWSVQVGDSVGEFRFGDRGGVERFCPGKFTLRVLAPLVALRMAAFAVALAIAAAAPPATATPPI